MSKEKLKPCPFCDKKYDIQQLRLTNKDSLTLTQCMALAYIYQKQRSFLTAFNDGKLDKDFFVTGMASLIGYIDNFVRENGAFSCG